MSQTDRQLRVRSALEEGEKEARMEAEYNSTVTHLRVDQLLLIVHRGSVYCFIEFFGSYS